MSDKSAIEWTEATWNPTTGCDRVSAGCDNCYALTLSKRLKAMGNPKYQNDGDPRTSGPGFGVDDPPGRLSIPYSWKRPRVVFVNSMSDLFHARVPWTSSSRSLTSWRDTPHHTYQVLTKRAHRLTRIADKLDWPSQRVDGCQRRVAEHYDRVRDLAKVPAAVRFLSCEPLLGPLPDLPLDGIDWVIAGGESGFNARPVDPEWFRELRDHALQARTPFFFKQWGGIRAKAGVANWTVARGTRCPSWLADPEQFGCTIESRLWAIADVSVRVQFNHGRPCILTPPLRCLEQRPIPQRVQRDGSLLDPFFDQISQLG